MDTPLVVQMPPKQYVLIKASTANPKKYRLARQTPMTLSVNLNDIELKKALTKDELASLSGNSKGIAKVTLSHGLSIDKSIPYGRAVIKILAMHPGDIALSLEQCQSNTRYYIEDAPREAEVRVTKKKKVVAAQSLIIKMNLREKREMCYALREKVQFYSESEMEDLLYVKAELDPDKFIDAYKDDQKNQKILIARLVEKGVFQEASNNNINYGDKLIGMDLDHALDWINDPRNADLVLQLTEIVKD